MIPYLRQQPLILASASPRRLELLRQIGLEPVVEPRPAQELTSLAGYSPAELVEQNAARKAQATLAAYRGQRAVILGSDTVVVLDGALFGKPADAAQAAAMLRQLAGRTHQVYTGICLIAAATGREVCGSRCTAVSFGPLTEAQIAAYLATGEPLDKAGAYGIQGAGGLFVERIDGDYGTVVGLSLPLLRRLAEELERSGNDGVHS